MKDKNLVWFYSFLVALLAISVPLDNLIADNMYLIKNSFLDFIVEGVAPFMSVIVVIIVMTSILMWEDKKKEWIPTLWASFAVTFMLTILLKSWVQRPRLIGELFYPMTNIIDYSFPSLHVSTVFSSIAILDREFPKFKWFWIFFGLFVAFSRMYLGFHYLTDVVAGAILGFSISYILVKIEEKHKLFKRWIFSK